jgi:hypothetical protein
LVRHEVGENADAAHEEIVRVGRTRVSVFDVDLSVTIVVEAEFRENGGDVGDILLCREKRRRMRDDS